MTHLVDLDDLVGLERAWCELERLRAVRNLDPALRRNIERHLDRLAPDVAAPVRATLDEMHPEMVLATYFEVIVPRGSLPTIAAVRFPQRPPAPPCAGTLASYRKVLVDMAGAGWCVAVARDAVATIAAEDGLEPDAVEGIRWGHAE